MFQTWPIGRRDYRVPRSLSIGTGHLLFLCLDSGYSWRVGSKEECLFLRGGMNQLKRFTKTGRDPRPRPLIFLDLPAETRQGPLIAIRGKSTRGPALCDRIQLSRNWSGQPGYEGVSVVALPADVESSEPPVPHSGYLV